MAAKQHSSVIADLEELCSSKITWEIRKVKFRREVGDNEFVSPTFHCRPFTEISWKLKHVDGCTQLCLVSSDRPKLMCTINWSYLNEEHEVICQMKTVKHTFSNLNEGVFLAEEEDLTMSQTPPSTRPQRERRVVSRRASFGACPDFDKFVINDKLIINVEVNVFVHDDSTNTIPW